MPSSTMRALQSFGILMLLDYGLCQTFVDQSFTPAVSATCKSGFMSIRINTNTSFIGAVHAKDYRTPACLSYGNGTNSVLLSVNMFARQDSPDYCGVLFSNKSDERSLAVAVRVHRTLELADDKFYVITCGKAGFRNARNETSVVSLKIMDADKSHALKEVYFSHTYYMRAEMTRPDGAYGIRVKECFAFNEKNRTVPLIDARGCPLNKGAMSPFVYNDKQGYADSKIASMFQFSDNKQMHLQCDVAVCKGGCPELNCDDELSSSKDIQEDGVLLASTSVFVLLPGQIPEAVITEARYGGGSWLLYLCIALGLLFLLMLIVNVFLCSAMTCSCARTEVIEKEPSIIEDYDPYRSWHGTQYGSRYSLNGKPGYVSGGSTLNSARSISTNSDHYAIVDSSRNSHRSPAPNMSHYTRKH